MSSAKFSWRIPSLSLAGYLVAFFSLAGLLYTLIGSWMLLQGEEITRIASEQRHQSADRELRGAMEKVAGRVEEITTHLSLWEEVYQQLGDPTFYEYWRTSRALQAGYTPPFVRAIELYDKSGRILQQGVDSRLPSTRLAQSHTIRIEEGRPYLYSFSLVSKKGDAVTVIGHIGIKIDYLEALLALNRFIHVDTDSLSFKAGKELHSVAEMHANTRFLPLPIAETQQLEELMHQTLSHFALISLLLLVVAFALASTLLYNPLKALARYINALRHGASGAEQELKGRGFCVKEFELLRSSIVNYQHELEQVHQNLDQTNRELWKMAHHDALTGVQNRRAYEEDWQKLQQLIRDQRIDLSIILIDCDHFKAINDSYGHEVGDQVLQAVAKVLSATLRNGDHLYRLGGDEFALHLLNTDAAQAHELASRCLQQMEQYDFRQLGIREPMRFSMGVATANGMESTPLQQLHKHADTAMYQAKRHGSSKIVHYSQELATAGDTLTSNRYITAIYRAIESGAGIMLHFQPVLSLEEKREGFHEVLLRLEDDDGIISPLNIFPIVEAEGLAVEMDFAIIRQLASQLEDHGDGLGRVSINIDGDTLMHHEFMAQIAPLQPHLERVAQGIILEITETALISELSEAGKRLQQLRRLGFTIALDDFGSGYSSLRYLSSMPVDIIKFDIELVRDLERGTTQAEITADMARMIQRTGYQMVAEGIENEELLEKVASLGFSHVQGFLFGRPATEPLAGELRAGKVRPAAQA